MKRSRTPTGYPPILNDKQQGWYHDRGGPLWLTNNASNITNSMLTDNSESEFDPHLHGISPAWCWSHVSRSSSRIEKTQFWYSEWPFELGEWCQLRLRPGHWSSALLMTAPQWRRRHNGLISYTSPPLVIMESPPPHLWPQEYEWCHIIATSILIYSIGQRRCKMQSKYFKVFSMRKMRGNFTVTLLCNLICGCIQRWPTEQVLVSMCTVSTGIT